VLPWFETREDALLTMRLPYLGARFASHRSPDEPTGRANARPMTGSATSGILTFPLDPAYRIRSCGLLTFGGGQAAAAIEPAGNLCRLRHRRLARAAENSCKAGKTDEKRAVVQSCLGIGFLGVPAGAGGGALYGRRPVAWLLTVLPRDLDFGEVRSPETKEDAASALLRARHWLARRVTHA